MKHYSIFLTFNTLPHVLIRIPICPLNIKARKGAMLFLKLTIGHAVFNYWKFQLMAHRLGLVTVYHERLQN